MQPHIFSACWLFLLVASLSVFIHSAFVSQTALLVAVTANQPEIVQDLLILGADISICDIKGQTALHLAATYGFPEVMKVSPLPETVHTVKNMP